MIRYQSLSIKRKARATQSVRMKIGVSGDEDSAGHDSDKRLNVPLGAIYMYKVTVSGGGMGASRNSPKRIALTLRTFLFLLAGHQTTRPAEARLLREDSCWETGTSGLRTKSYIDTRADGVHHLLTERPLCGRPLASLHPLLWCTPLFCPAHLL